MTKYFQILLLVLLMMGCSESNRRKQAGNHDKREAATIPGSETEVAELPPEEAGTLGPKILPRTNQVAKYERCDSEGEWRELAKSDGDVVLSCLRDIGEFRTWDWDSTFPPRSMVTPIPTVLGFRITDTSGKTYLVRFSSRGELVDCQKGLLAIPDQEEKILAQLLAKWREADNKRIASQPLPCQYRIGTANDDGTLSGVARLFYGDATKWRKIYEANKDAIEDPDIIHGGTVITIPKMKETSNKALKATRTSRAP